MKCPKCQKETRTLIYKGATKQCRDCANPDYIHALHFGFNEEKCIIPYEVFECAIQVTGNGVRIQRVVRDAHDGRN